MLKALAAQLRPQSELQTAAPVRPLPEHILTRLHLTSGLLSSEGQIGSRDISTLNASQALSSLPTAWRRTSTGSDGGGVGTVSTGAATEALFLCADGVGSSERLQLSAVRSECLCAASVPEHVC